MLSRAFWENVVIWHPSSSPSSGTFLVLSSPGQGPKGHRGYQEGSALPRQSHFSEPALWNNLIFQSGREGACQERMWTGAEVLPSQLKCIQCS